MAIILVTIGGNRKDNPRQGEPPFFSHFYLRQMRAEELYESLIVATEAEKTESTPEKMERAKEQWLSQFVTTFGTDENDETTTFNGTIPQTLMMMNGDLMLRATRAEPGSFLHRVATDGTEKNSAKIRFLYLAALSRAPTAKEIRRANEVLRLRQGDVSKALQDVWWALLNSNEFILNH